MSEWSTYSLSDFLMFSPQAYWRLVARYNAAWWPAQLVALGAGFAAWWLLGRRQQRQARGAVLLVLALAWGWLGWAFFLRNYAEIFLASAWIAAACGVQAVLLIAAAAWPWREPVADRTPTLGIVLLAVGLLYPLLSAWSGRSWSEAEVFGFMPDPTALATLGALIALPQLATPVRAVLAIIPVAMFALGMATRWLIA
jgi:hypothetical protein